MTMAARSTRRFIACLGFIETPTNEPYPRTLKQQKIMHRMMPAELVPVLERHGGRVRSVGTIYDVLAMGSMILGLGYLTADTQEDRIRITSLSQGAVFMELDIDGRAREEQWGMEFYGWRVRAVTLGTSPCWILPPVHIWEG